jgi:predicted  nucleic acid-binding Zn-ribbon protein
MIESAEEEASQLRDEKNNLDEYSSGLQESLESTHAEIAFIKRESENKVQEFMTQLDRLNMQQEALLPRLQIVRSDNEKLMNTETNYIQRKQDLCSKISELETEIQTVLKDKNRLIERIKECDSVKAEF